MGCCAMAKVYTSNFVTIFLWSKGLIEWYQVIEVWQIFNISGDFIIILCKFAVFYIIINAMKLDKPAILVVDMLNDFVTGALTCERGRAIVPATASLLDAARAAGVPVIFCNDAHRPGIDRELEIWGDHAIVGTEGAEVIPELNLCEKDYVVPKRRYSGFFQTDLDILLKELGVKTVVMTGLHAHMCVRHTSADAFCLGYDVVVAKEATDSFTEEDYLNGLAYLKTCYGADAYSNEELIAAF